MEGLFYQSFGFKKSNVYNYNTIIIWYAVLLKKIDDKVAIVENVCMSQYHLLDVDIVTGNP